MNTARQSRNRTKKADRKIEDRKMKLYSIFLSSIFLSSCLSAAPLPQLSRSLRTIATVAVQHGKSATEWKRQNHGRTESFGPGSYGFASDDSAFRVFRVFRG
jgi:hypothetical protein